MTTQNTILALHWPRPGEPGKHVVIAQSAMALSIHHLLILEDAFALRPTRRRAGRYQPERHTTNHVVARCLPELVQHGLLDQDHQITDRGVEALRLANLP
jgi:hypothetical protein